MGFGWHDGRLGWAVGGCSGGGLGGVDGGSMDAGSCRVAVIGRLMSSRSVFVDDDCRLFRLFWYRCRSRLISCLG